MRIHPRHLAAAWDKLDGWLIDRVFQPVINRLQIAQPLEASCLCLSGFAGIALLELLLARLRDDPEWSSFAMGLYVGMALASYLLAYHRSGRPPPPAGVVSPYRYAFLARETRFVALLFWLLATLLTLLGGGHWKEWLGCLSNLTLVGAFYFEACQGAPPRRKTFKAPSAADAETEAGAA